MTTSEAMWRWEIRLPQVLDTDSMIALLDAQGCSGFEEFDDCLLAYAPATPGAQEQVNAWLQSMQIKAEQSVVAPQNWNAVWEANFSPITIGDFVHLRAHFHPPIPHLAHDLVITPKMSFGTGHHATTQLMVLQMQQLDFEGKRVLDFGTGTGVLGILAKKLGAGEVIALDNDDWSMANAAENAEINGVELALAKSDHPTGFGTFDIILANINLHILLEHAAALKNCLAPSGVLLLSGILASDKETIKTGFANVGLTLASSQQQQDWMVCRMEAAEF